MPLLQQTPFVEKKMIKSKMKKKTLNKDFSDERADNIQAPLRQSVQVSRFLSLISEKDWPVKNSQLSQAKLIAKFFMN